MTTRFLILTIILSVSCSLAADESFKNFRIPDHKVFASGMEGGGGYLWNQSDYSHGTNKTSTISGDLDAGLRWLRDSDSFRSILTAGAGLDRRRQKSNFDNSEDGSSGEDVLSTSHESIGVGWEGWYYPTQAPVGTNFEINSRLYTDNRLETHTGKWAHETTKNTHTREEIEKRLNRTVNVSAGFVYGRVRDASTIYQMKIYEQRLIEEGALSGELLPSTLEKLAELYSKTEGMSYEYERYGRYFAREFEEILYSDPAFIPQEFDLYTRSRMSERVNGVSWPMREVGFAVGPYVKASHYFYHTEFEDRDFTYYSGPDSSGTNIASIGETEYKGSEDKVQVGLQAEYHLPLSLRWQFDLSSSVSKSVEPENDGFNAVTTFSAYYVIADRWGGRGRFYHSRELYDPKDEGSEYQQQPYSRWSLDLDARLEYYVESKTTIYVSLGHSQRGSSYPDRPSSDYFNKSFSASVGFAYNFTGFINTTPRYWY